MSHQAKAVVLHCMDYRFVHKIVHFLKDRGLIDQYDDVAAAGAAKNLVDPMIPSDKEFVLRQLQMAKKFHDVQQVVMINHKDCGGYGKIFNSPEEELARHTKDLKAAKKLVEAEIPGVTVATYLAGLQSDGHVEFTPIEA